jgi:hypothetical protein
MNMLSFRKLTVWLLAAACVLPAAGSLAATVRYNIVPASDRNARTRTILTGTPIKYYITAEVISDTAEADNSGLALFNINVETDLTVEQPPATEFIRDIFNTFTLFRSLGQPSDDDIIGIGASQSTFTPTSATTGIGQRGNVELVTGLLQSPDFEGEFTVVIDAANSTANVLPADYSENGGSISAREITAGPGFTIITDNNGQQDPGDQIQPFQGMSDAERFAITAGSIGLAGLIIVLGALIGGGWGAAIGLFMGALVGLLSLIFGGMTFTGG